MNKRNTHPLIAATSAAIIMIILFLVAHYLNGAPTIPPDAPIGELQGQPALLAPLSDVLTTSSSTVIALPNGNLRVFIATTTAEQELGLGRRASLPEDEGMIFVFPYPSVWSFWMKDMAFPLDMVWISDDQTVIGVQGDVKPDSYPATFIPPSPVRYVLEMNAGAAEKFGIQKGTRIDF